MTCTTLMEPELAHQVQLHRYYFRQSSIINSQIPLKASDAQPTETYLTKILQLSRTLQNAYETFIIPKKHGSAIHLRLPRIKYKNKTQVLSYSNNTTLARKSTWYVFVNQGISLIYHFFFGKSGFANQGKFPDLHPKFISNRYKSGESLPTLVQSK